MQTLPLALARGVPYAIIYHSYRGYRRKGTGLLTRLGNLVRGLVARAAAANIFTSDHSRQVAGTPQARSYVLLNPVDKAMEALYADHRYSEGQLTRKAVGTARRSGDSRRVLRLLFAGRLIEGKGVFDLMDALRRLDGEADLHLTFAGSGPAEDALRQQARTLEHVEVVLAGRLSTQALVAAYEDADVLVVPSSTHKEGNPLVVAEAIYAGTPVVASDQPPMVESIGSAGLLFEVGEAAQLAEVLDRLSRDDELYARVAAEAERRRKVFSYNRYIEDLSCIIHSAFGYIE
jgi:glycosyltransferase involved in cell wall biosynthesis